MVDDKKPKYTEQNFIDQLKDEIKFPLFKDDDLKAAASVGLFYRLLSYQQESKLGTRTLVKDARYLINDIDKIKLLKLFKKTCEVAFVIKDKDRRKQLNYSNIRLIAEDYLKNATWQSSSEELSLAFMIGYDSWLRTIIKLKPEELENEVDEDDSA